VANICVIDDDLASELLVENLRHRGHNVERIAVADQAVQNAQRLAQADLVILDLIMPRSGDISETSAEGVRATGMLAFQALRQARKDLPILVFTANQDPAIVDVVENDHHARYLSRWSSPKFQAFIKVVHEMLGVELQEVALQSFIVHGHDDKTKLEVKNFLQNTLHLPEPIILHEQPNLGRTLIEKFEDLSATADLAFVLLTPDDMPVGAKSSDAEKRRARQNVIFELGFFLGMLGRRSGRVFLMYRGPLELPSDLSGVVYLDIGKGVDAVGEQIRLELEALRKMESE
jgi:CheY-like chemotaxis protein